MHHHVNLPILKSILALNFAICCMYPPSAINAQSLGWPREIDTVKGKLTIYQPQLESFTDNKLTARAAMSFDTSKDTPPAYGAVWFAARLSTDRDERIVTLSDITVTDARFPDITDDKKKFIDSSIEQSFAGTEHTMSLDRLIAALDLVEQENKTARNFDNSPPKIIYSQTPTILITIDGDPELRPTDHANVMRLINTPFFIVLDRPSKTYYLKLTASWTKTQELNQPWQPAAAPPGYILNIAENEQFSDPPDETTDDLKTLPNIIVTTEPTELIQSKGEPTFTPIESTNLLYMSNTDSDIFMLIDSQQYYLLISGRWFTSNTLTENWSHTPAGKLPPDFATIPSDSEKQHVLASVAGTEQATDAVREAQIPQTAVVNRKDATLQVTYDGQPQFQKIESTDMFYAVNTSYAVIRAGHKYYCCDNAVWFVANHPQGPWQIADEIPQEIYTIPPDCPVYNTIYVHIFDDDDDIVYVGYYPGYLCSYVDDDVVIYGTGYWYRRWVRRYYWPRPTTYGFAVRYNSHTGNWGFRYGYRAPYASVVTTHRRSNWWGPTGYRQHYAQKQYRQNVYQHRNDLRREQHQQVRDTRSLYRSHNLDYDAVRKRDQRNNIYADREGNIYRRTDNGWQQHQQTGWTDRNWQHESGNMNRNQRVNDRRQTQRQQNLNREYQVRQRGSNRTYNYQRHTARRYGGGRGRR